MTATLEDVPTWEALADLYGKVAHEDQARELIMAEAARRERSEKQRGQWAALRSAWEEAAHAQMLAASAECRGRLVDTRHGHAPAWVTDWHLWTCTPTQAERWCSEELRGYWADHPRVGLGDYRGRIAQGKRIQRDEIDALAQDNATEGEPVTDYAPEAPTVAQPTRDRMAELREQGRKRAAELRQQAGAGTVAVRDGSALAAKFPPIDGVRLADAVKRYLTHHVSFPSDDAANVTVAWLLHAVARNRDDKGVGPLIWRATPRLLVTSRKRGSGKSTLLDLIVMLTKSRNGKIPKITPRAIAHVLGELQEAVVLDEAKTIFGAGQRSLELQGILLAGYTRRTNYVISAGSKNKSLPLFGPVAYAGKDELITETNGQLGDLLDRSLVIRMKPPARPMAEVDERAEDMGEALGELLAAWTDSVRGQLMQAARDLADEDREAADTLDEDDPAAAASLRASQISRPLRACGRVLGPEWEAAITDGIDALTAGSAAAELVGAMDDMERQLAAAGYLSGETEPSGYMVTDDNYSDEED